MKPSFLLAIGLLAAASMTVTANTISYPNAGVVPASATFRAEATGDVTAYFYGSTATFTEEVGLAVNGVRQNDWALPNHGSLFGDSFNFGAVHAGDVLTFLLHVDDTGNTFSSEPGSNPDGINHEYVRPFAGEARANQVIPAGVFVGFEDELMAFSDLNYNDEDVVFEDVAAQVTPEPMPFWLLGVGLTACVGSAAHKRGK